MFWGLALYPSKIIPHDVWWCEDYVVTLYLKIINKKIRL